MKPFNEIILLKTRYSILLNWKFGQCNTVVTFYDFEWFIHVWAQKEMLLKSGYSSKDISPNKINPKQL